MKRFLQGTLVALMVVLGATHALDQLSKKDPDGTTLGQSSTDKISFYGVTPVVQPSGGDQATVTDNSGGTKSATTGVSANAQKELVIIPVGKLTPLTSGFIYKVALPYAFTIQSALFRVAEPVTGSGKAATLRLRVDGTYVTGGSMALTSATLTPTGATVAASAVSGTVAGAAGQTLEFDVQALTAFTEGSGWVEVTVANGDKANQSATLAAVANAWRTVLLALGLVKGSS